MIAQCKCSYCSGQIEFDPATFGNGTLALCPHCGMATTLMVPIINYESVSAIETVVQPEMTEGSKNNMPHPE